HISAQRARRPAGWQRLAVRRRRIALGASCTRAVAAHLDRRLLQHHQHLPVAMSFRCRWSARLLKEATNSEERRAVIGTLSQYQATYHVAGNVFAAGSRGGFSGTCLHSTEEVAGYHAADRLQDRDRELDR